ncbi:MAG TPA: hypothetical protein VNS58_23855 [Puia sp.]|nr:hypothetical protein [Puia sp.]
MIKYLLLRDNKESGPYTFDELKAKGLKAYDLVWVENKSAAWRYPCEVEELSSFAPAVEEQPFDRFYKKPSQENNSPVTAATIRLKQNGSSAFSGEPSAVPGKRIIYVTLPAGKNTPAKEPAPVASATGRLAAPLPERFAASAAIPDRSSSTYGPIPSDNGPVAAPQPEEKSSQAREDWNAGVEIMPRANKRRKGAPILQSIVVVSCVLALLAAGIFIGLSINKGSLGFAEKMALKKGPVNPPPPAGHAAGTLAASSAAPVMQALPPVTDTVHTANLPETETAVVSTPKKPVGSKEKSSQLSPKNQPVPPSPVKDSAMTGLSVVHREASHRADMPVDKIDKEVLRNNLSNLVSVGANGYTVGTFGGISRVQLTVSNKSVYPLDLVVVEVQYVQANKKVFKTENLYFRGIGPGSALMQEAPNSSRGIKVQYKITLVNSKELGLSYSAL